VQQLSQVKKQLDEETQHLTNSYAQLRSAQSKFRDCIASIVAGVADSVADKPLLVPLTSSLYVPGTLASTDTVLVDVGTGFYVEKTTEQARKFYEAKTQELGRNVKDLEAIVNGKNQNLSMIEEGMLCFGLSRLYAHPIADTPLPVLRQKLLAQNQAPASSASASS
jgi:prefoldin alpha subunit